MPKGTPYTIDVTAQVTARLLVYIQADEEMSDYAFLHLVDETVTSHTEALINQVQATAALPDNNYVTYEVDIRNATGAEVGGDDALDEGILRFDYCDHEDHHHHMDFDDEEAA